MSLYYLKKTIKIASSMMISGGFGSSSASIMLILNAAGLTRIVGIIQGFEHLIFILVRFLFFQLNHII